MEEEIRMNQIHNYLSKLGRALVANGATIEHAEIAITKNAQAYQVKGLSTVITHQYISVCFHDDKRNYIKQLSMNSTGIKLEKLKLLNDISYRISSHPIPPEELADALRNTKKRELTTY